ncbi:hypothetical protein HDU93_008668 [Gonapodya sp. JEL0774]|nr:hypothetical protein HDU93_008668 [Gonapodya sp. JEL0774]
MHHWIEWASSVTVSNDVRSGLSQDAGVNEEIAKKAAAIERAIYNDTNGGKDESTEPSQNTLSDYCESIRTHYLNLKGRNLDLRKRVLCGEIDEEAFAKMSAEDMRPPELKEA